MKSSIRNRPRLTKRSRIRFHSAVRNLIWLWACAALLHLAPSNAHATKQKSLKSTAIKDKWGNSPARNGIKSPVQRLLNKEKLGSDKEPLEIREHAIHKAGRGETLAGIVGRLKLTTADKQLWRRHLLANFGNRPLPAGKEINFYFAKDAGGALFNPLPRVELMAVELDRSDATSLVWEKNGPTINFQELEKPYDIEVQTVSTVIENSLFEDGRRAGIQPTLLSQLTDIFTWDLDFEKGLTTGDSVKILFEKRIRKGNEALSYLRILAAELNNAGQRFTAIYFEKEKGRGAYYDLDGRSLARAFLRFPVEFANITSPFSASRVHPILKTHRPHTGIDFAAKRGTPVRAVGDGVITVAGWNGPYGKTIDLQHDLQYLSRYAHLQKFAPGIRNGVEVKKGQIIGYVGSTGRSTGPHLHFELYKDQQYVNPLSVDLPSEDTIEPALLRSFDDQKRTYLIELASAPET